MRWQKVARTVVAMAGLGTAAAVYFLTHERPEGGPPPASIGVDPNATFQSGPAREERFERDRLVGEMTYGGIRKYDDGRIQWDKFTYTFANGNTMAADLVEGKGMGPGRDLPETFELRGHVVFGGGDRGTFAGESATFNDTTGLATVPGEATFTRGRISGTGTGGSYERDSGVFKLFADTHVSIAPEASGGTGIEATSRAMTFVPDSRTMRFDQQAHIVRDAETLAGDVATLYLSDDEQWFRTIELLGNAQVTPAPGKVSDLPEMRAGDIELNFHEGGQALQRAALHRQAVMIQAGEQGRRSISAPEIAFVTAPDGRTLTRLEGSGRVTVTLPVTAGAPPRTIAANTLVASGNAKGGLTAAIFEGRAEFEELLPAAEGRPAVKRTGTAAKLALALRGQLEAIDTAAFERDTHFTSGDVTGDADMGEYQALKGELILRPFPVKPQKTPRVTTADVAVEADEIISINLNTTDVSARLRVGTVTQPRAGQAGSALFNDKDPLYGSAHEFSYSNEAGRFRYVGRQGAPAQLRQADTNVVRGTEIQFVQKTQDLQATGDVETAFLMTTGGAGSKTSRYTGTGDSFGYVDATHRVLYLGTPATLKGPDQETTARRIDLTLSTAGQSVDLLEASGGVRMRLSGGRDIRGERLRYEPPNAAYHLWGKAGEPLAIWTRESDGLCKTQSGNYATFDGGLGVPNFPPDSNPRGSSLASKLPCPPAMATGK